MVRRRYLLRIWWHCLWRISLLDYGHRMCHVLFPKHDPNTRFYYCSCGYHERQAWKLWDTGELDLPSNATGQWR